MSHFLEKKGGQVPPVPPPLATPLMIIYLQDALNIQHMDISGGFRGGSEVSMEPPFLAKSKIDRYTKATVVG